MAPPNTHYTRARKIKKGRNGVYVTKAARQLRRQRRYQAWAAEGRKVGKDVLWGGLFFTAFWVTLGVVVVGYLVLFG